MDKKEIIKVFEERLNKIKQDVNCPICENPLWCNRCKSTWGKHQYLFYYTDIVEALESALNQQKTNEVKDDK